MLFIGKPMGRSMMISRSYIFQKKRGGSVKKERKEKNKDKKKKREKEKKGWGGKIKKKEGGECRRVEERGHRGE